MYIVYVYVVFFVFCSPLSVFWVPLLKLCFCFARFTGDRLRSWYRAAHCWRAKKKKTTLLTSLDITTYSPITRCCSHVSWHKIKSVVTGQAPVTLEWRNIPRKKKSNRPNKSGTRAYHSGRKSYIRQKKYVWGACARRQNKQKNRFTEGSGWLQGTQVFLELGPRTGESGGSTSAKYSVDPSPGAATATVDEGGGDIAQVSITVRNKTSGGR